MAFEKLKIAAEGLVRILTLADPVTLNAINVDMARDLRQAMVEAPAAGMRAIVLTGEGRGFCSGTNLTNLEGGSIAQDSGDRMKTVYDPMVTAFRDLPIPIVTAINGAAAGIGCSLALLGDIIVAGESAYFLQAFRRIGIIPDGGATYLLPRMIGKARAMEMALFGEKLPAAKALEWGMINRCVPDADLMPTALALATELANGPASLGLTRQAVLAGLENDWHAQLEWERRGQGVARRTLDAAEGVAAFLGRRPAVFIGR